MFTPGSFQHQTWFVGTFASDFQGCAEQLHVFCSTVHKTLWTFGMLCAGLRLRSFATLVFSP